MLRRDGSLISCKGYMGDSVGWRRNAEARIGQKLDGVCECSGFATPLGRSALRVRLRCVALIHVDAAPGLAEPSGSEAERQLAPLAWSGFEMLGDAGFAEQAERVTAVIARRGCGYQPMQTIGNGEVLGSESLGQ